MEDCIFCKIAKKEISSEILYEDDMCVVFRDINPKAKTHLLVVNKVHNPVSIAEMSEDQKTLVGHMVYVTKLVAKDLGLPGYKIQIHVGMEGGQEIFHLHVHLMSNH